MMTAAHDNRRLCFLQAMKRSRPTIRLGIVGLVVLVGIGISSRTESKEPGSVVALVEKQPVQYQEIAASHISDKPKRLSREKKLLRIKIRNLLRATAYKQWGIQVKEKEIDAEMAPWLSKLKSKVSGVKEPVRLRLLINALEEAIKEPDRENQIYEEKLSKHYTLSEWQSHRKNYGTSQKLETLKNLYPLDLEKVKGMKSASL